MRRLLHRIAHLLSWNLCVITVGHDERGSWVGAACATCGAVNPKTKWYPNL